MERELENPELYEMMKKNLNLEVKEDAGQGTMDWSVIFWVKNFDPSKTYSVDHPWIPGSGHEIIITTAMKGPLFTEKHAQELKKSMKNDFDEMKNKMKEDLKKLAEEDFEEMKNQIQEDLNGLKGEIGGLKKMAKENLEKMKNDFESQKEEMKAHFEDMKNQMKGDLKKSNEEVLKGMKTSLKDRLHQRALYIFIIK